MKRWISLALFLGILLAITLPSLADSGLRMSIAGQVVDKATGKGIRRVGIWLTRDTWQPPDALTDEEGKFIIRGLKAGRYRIIAIDTSYGYVVSRIYPSKEVEVKDGENVWVKIEMEKGGVIEGKVVDREGHPVVTRRFSTNLVDTIIPVGDLVKLYCDEVTRFSKTDREGRFRLEGVPKGEECILQAGFDGYPLYREKVALGEGEDRKEVTIVLGTEKAD